MNQEILEKVTQMVENGITWPEFKEKVLGTEGIIYTTLVDPLKIQEFYYSREYALINALAYRVINASNV